MHDPVLEQALALHQSRRFAEAEALYRQILQRQPNEPNALHLYGLLAQQTSRLDLAVQLLTGATRVAPQIGAFHLHLAAALHAANRLDEAIAVMARAVQLEPNDPFYHRNYGVLLATSGRTDDAIVHLKKVVELKPDDAESSYNLGTAYIARSKYKEALAELKRAVELEPDRAETHCNLGAAYRALWEFEPAIKHYRRALELKPDYPDALYNLGAVYHALIDQPNALECYRRCLQLRPQFNIAHSSLIFDMHYQAPFDVRAIYEECLRFDRQHVQPLRSQIQPQTNDRSINRKLRIGYVSADFFQHSVAYFIEPIFKHFDRSRFEVYVYSSTLSPDGTTRRLHGYVNEWRQIPNFPDDRVAQIIRQDKIDILVDLSGHTSHNRMLVFARKPAPVQISYLGFPNTTGVSTMDYRLADPVADPPGEGDELYVEKLIRLPRTMWCYQPAPDAPEPNELPSIATGQFTFGSFNNLNKLNEALIALWCRLLHEAPNSRLLLKSPTLQETPVRERVVSWFAQHGIDESRLTLSGRIISYNDHLNLYHQVDLALDSFPYNGTTTTCEALWMGVPVVTLAGNHHLSRVGKSILTQVGLHDFVTTSEEEYLNLAKQLASDSNRLSKLRSTLRERMQSAPLLDAPTFTRDLESIYTNLFSKWARNF